MLRRRDERVPRALEPAPRLFVFGAGYIARPLAALAAGCGFDVTVVDERAEWATPERFPTVARASAATPEAFARERSDRRRRLRGGRDPRPRARPARGAGAAARARSRFVGHDRQPPQAAEVRAAAAGARIHRRARSRGSARRSGVAIGASTPEEIAVSVMAELIGGAARRHGGPPASVRKPAATASGSSRGEVVMIVGVLLAAGASSRMGSSEGAGEEGRARRSRRTRSAPCGARATAWWWCSARMPKSVQAAIEEEFARLVERGQLHSDLQRGAERRRREDLEVRFVTNPRWKRRHAGLGADRPRRGAHAQARRRCWCCRWTTPRSRRTRWRCCRA